MQIIKNTWPKAVRLNAENRDKFVNVVVQDVMPEESEPCEENFVNQFASTMYDDVYGPHLETMKKLPKWMFVKNDNFWVDLYAGTKKAGDDGVIKFPCKAGSLVVEDEDNWCHDTSAALPEIPPGHPAIDAYKQMLQEEVDWSTKRNELRQQLNTMVYECNTSHQLFRAWPTALKYAQDCFPYEAPAPAKQGGNTTVSAEELDIGVLMAKTTVTGVSNN